MQLTFLVTSPRVAPGLMSAGAWRAVESADRVLASDAQDPTARAVAAAGYRVDVLPGFVAGDLVDAAGAGDVVWLATDEEADRMPRYLAQRVVTGAQTGRPMPVVEVLHGSYDVPGARLLDLVAVLDRLRTSCPWDREQTHRSLARYLLEEAYETLEAIDTGDPAHLREELGDLLLQVLFHARIATEDSADGFDIDHVAAGIVEKLVHRHPHVFAGAQVADAEEVAVNWESLKATEKDRRSVLDGIPRSLPALALADKVLGRAAGIGAQLDQAGACVPGAAGASVAGAAALEALRFTHETAGALLLQMVAGTRAAGVDAEQALRDAVRRLAAAVRQAESGGPEAD